MNRQATAAGAVIIAAILIVAAGWYLAGPGKNTAGPLEPVTVAYSPFESSGLFLVAVDQHFFEQNGLNLTLYRSSSGAAALDDMLNGKADMAVSVSEYPLVSKVFQGTTARALASMDKAEYIYIVARKDRGIVNASDLKGKRIGTSTGSIAGFYLGRFLTLNGMGIGDVRTVNIATPGETADAVVDGDLDAAVLAQPYADQARDLLGANATSWPAQSSQPLFALVVSTEEWIAGHPDQASRFLRALAEAEAYTNAHPAGAGAIIQRELNFDPAYMDTVRQQNQFGLSLDQSLVLAMEDESRWMIANNLTNATAVPDFGKYIYPDALNAVKPGSVNVIG